jgi:hypothetical protein
MQELTLRIGVTKSRHFGTPNHGQARTAGWNSGLE